jgi:UTP-glucose-1-phosphate uridylyltransferase
VTRVMDSTGFSEICIILLYDKIKYENSFKINLILNNKIKNNNKKSNIK